MTKLLNRLAAAILGLLIASMAFPTVILIKITWASEIAAWFAPMLSCVAVLFVLVGFMITRTLWKDEEDNWPS